MFSEQEWEKIARTLTLTRRELQIIRCIFDDRTESAIAACLSVSPHTVHTYFNRLYRKLAVHTRAGLILRVVDASLGTLANDDGDVTRNPNRQRPDPSP